MAKKKKGFARCPDCGHLHWMQKDCPTPEMIKRRLESEEAIRRGAYDNGC